MRDRLKELLINSPYLDTVFCSFEKATDWLIERNVVIQNYGEWKQISKTRFPKYIGTCCGKSRVAKKYKFCPECGAKMERNNENAE